MSGPNTSRYLDPDHVSIAWVEMPIGRSELANRFPALNDADIDAIEEIYAELQHRIADVGETSFIEATDMRAQAVSNLEQVTDKVARAIPALPDQAKILEHIFGLLVQAQISAKQTIPEKVAASVMTVGDAKQVATRKLIDLAERRGADARELVRALEIHDANSTAAWDKWYSRCAAK